MAFAERHGAFTQEFKPADVQETTGDEVDESERKRIRETMYGLATQDLIKRLANAMPTSEGKEEQPFIPHYAASADAKLEFLEQSDDPIQFASNVRLRNGEVGALNKKQTAAFVLVADALLAEMKAEDDKLRNGSAQRPPRLRLYVGGSGGVGKTHLIDAILWKIIGS